MKAGMIVGVSTPITHFSSVVSVTCARRLCCTADACALTTANNSNNAVTTRITLLHLCFGLVGPVYHVWFPWTSAALSWMSRPAIAVGMRNVSNAWLL
jgi:hypothetical protein